MRRCEKPMKDPTPLVGNLPCCRDFLVAYEDFNSYPFTFFSINLGTILMLIPLHNALRYCVFFILLTIVMLIAPGCSSARYEQPVAPVGTRENGMLILNQDDNNRTAEVKVGEQVAIRLSANPATGFTWAVDENDSRLLALESTHYIEPSEPGVIGARGRQFFTFTARQAGEVTLKLKYWRFWDGDASVAERYAITLQIQAVTH